MKNQNILISGASIAGTTLAYWLHRHGFTPTVVERAPAIREGGYKVDIRGAAIDVVERMGVLADIEREHTDMKATSYVDSSGKRIATMDADLFMGRGENDVEIMRGDLNRILYETTKDEIEYIFDDSIASITEDDGGAHVTFERGEPRTFDLVVGADGLHSNVRSLAFGEESAFVHDLGHYVSIFTTPNHLNLDRWELLYATPGKTTNVYSTRQDTAAKAMLLFSAPPLTYDRQDIGAQKKIVTDTYGGEGWELATLLESMRDATDFYFDRISQIHMDSWSSGRTALVGDAGYGPSLASGQGTSLALVGAYVLAGELAAAASDHEVAFAAYDTEMRDFVLRNQKLGQNNMRQMVVGSAPLLWFQVQMLKVLPYLPWRGLIIGTVTRPIEQASKAITLKEYAS